MIEVTFEAFYVKVSKAVCVCVQQCSRAKTIKVVNFQRCFLCPVCASRAHKRGDLSGALAQTVTAPRSSAYENKC